MGEEWMSACLGHGYRLDLLFETSRPNKLTVQVVGVSWINSVLGVNRRTIHSIGRFQRAYHTARGCHGVNP